MKIPTGRKLQVIVSNSIDAVLTAIAFLRMVGRLVPHLETGFQIVSPAYLSSSVSIDFEKELCLLSISADRGVFTGISRTINRAVKCSPQDTFERSAHIIEHFCKNNEPDVRIRDWVRQYDEEVEPNNAYMLSNVVPYGEHIFVSQIQTGYTDVGHVFSLLQLRAGARVLIIAGKESHEVISYDPRINVGRCLGHWARSHDQNRVSVYPEYTVDQIVSRMRMNMDRREIW